MPYVKFPQVNKKYGNSGSCRMDAEYLSKEGKDKGAQEQEMFFNKDNDYIGKESAIKTIDSAPKQGLTKDDAKYYEVILSFDKNELKGKSNEELKNYVKENFANVYADSVKGKTVDPDKLVWVAKLEQERKYKGFDDDVKQGKAKTGQQKEGDQRHVHVIIARKTEDNKMQISPLSNHRQESKGMIKSGFDRNNFRQETEKSFDKQFNYNRPMEQKFEYLNTMKNGTKEQQQELQQQRQQQKQEELKQQQGRNNNNQLSM